MNQETRSPLNSEQWITRRGFRLSRNQRRLCAEWPSAGDRL